MRLIEIWKNKKENNDDKPLFYCENASYYIDLYNSFGNNIDKSLLVKYGNREFDLDIFENIPPYIALRELFNVFVVTNNKNYKMIFDVINKEYNPLNNYDKTSNTSTQYQGNEMFEQINGERTSDNIDSRNSYDNTIDFEDTFKQSQTINESTDTNTHSFNDRVDIFTEHTFGNIGVTTTDKMLEEFITLRPTLDFYNMLFENFLLEYSW